MVEILHSFSGVLVNVLTVVVGSIVGIVLKKQIPEKLTGAVMTAIGLCTIAIGIMGIIKGENQLVMIISMVLGVVVGTLLDIDGKLQKIGDKLQKKKTILLDGFLAGAEGLDSRACGRLVARGHNSPPDCCSVPLVLQVLLIIKKKTAT